MKDFDQFAQNILSSILFFIQKLTPNQIPDILTWIIILSEKVPKVWYFIFFKKIYLFFESFWISK